MKNTIIQFDKMMQNLKKRIDYNDEKKWEKYFELEMKFCKIIEKEIEWYENNKCYTETIHNNNDEVLKKN